MIYIDLTWYTTKYGGFQHYANQIISLLGGDHNYCFLIRENSEHLFNNLTNVRVIKHKNYKNKMLSIVYSAYFRLFKLALVQKKLNAPFIFPSFPPPFI